jgi:Kef-type K+ transport system membrane component KefB
MAAQSAAAPDQTMFSRWMRDYRISLALLVVGVAVVVVLSAFSYWANSTGNYPTSFWIGLALYATATGAGMLILLAGTVAYYHWRGLRLIEGNA